MLQGLFAVVLVFAAVVGGSIGLALAAPGPDTMSTRLADWGRDHGLGGVVMWFEPEHDKQGRQRSGGPP
ncbi:MAG TPA: hypothetical protein VGG05_17575 [Pseudonocardiaceae bacterium]